MSAVLGNVAADHPAKWSSPVVLELAEVVATERERQGHPLAVLDPFAGIGRGRLADALRPNASEVLGVELQPEWCADELTIKGSACHLPGSGGGRAACGPWAEDWTGRFHAVVTSPCYGNRCADHHQAADRCKACRGQGAVESVAGHCFDIDGGRWHDVGQCKAPECGYPERPARCCPVCPTCKGTGLSWRNTYAHALRRHGADLVPGSAAGLAWGPEYRGLHKLALAEMIRVVAEGGLLAINMSNHPRTEVTGGPQVEQLVVEWWLNEVIVAGCRIHEVRRVATSRNGFGANGGARVDGEVIIVAHTPPVRRLAWR